MEDYYNFMYRRTKRSLICYYSVAMFQAILLALFDILQATDVVPANHSSLKVIAGFCDDSSKGSGLKFLSMSVLWIEKVSFLNLILICFAVVFLKSKDDLIERINKLHFLNKVSIFQVYRDRNHFLSAHNEFISLASTPSNEYLSQSSSRNWSNTTS
jgi:hypothetical protein